MVLSDGRNWGPTPGPFLHAPVSGLSEALLCHCFTADCGCGSCLGLGCSDLLEPHREFSLLGTIGLLPQQVGLLIEELVQSGQIVSHLVQRVYFMAAPFQASHAGFPNRGSDGRRKEPHWRGC